MENKDKKVLLRVEHLSQHFKLGKHVLHLNRADDSAAPVVEDAGRRLRLGEARLQASRDDFRPLCVESPPRQHLDALAVRVDGLAVRAFGPADERIAETHKRIGGQRLRDPVRERLRRHRTRAAVRVERHRPCRRRRRHLPDGRAPLHHRADAQRHRAGGQSCQRQRADRDSPDKPLHRTLPRITRSSSASRAKRGTSCPPSA